MATQTLIAFYCFNDNSASSVKDFSVNERHSSSVTNLTISTSDLAVGKVGVFNGTSSTINFGNIAAFNSLAAFTIIAKIKLNLLGVKQVVSFRDASHYLEITSANKIKFMLDNGSAITLTHTQVLTTGIWYAVIGLWDGINMYVYIDAIDNVTSGAMTGTLSSNSNNLYIGNDGVDDWFNGSMEMISYYSKALTTSEIETIMESPSGIKFEAADAKLQTGDLILNNAGGKEVVVWYEEFDERSFSDTKQHYFNDTEPIIFK